VVSYEKTVRGYSKDEVIRRDSSGGCSVSLQAIIEGREYTFTRTRKHSEYQNSFTITGVDCEKGKEQEIVEALLGVDHKTFLYIIMMGQNSGMMLGEANDKDQKSLYEKVLISDDFDSILAHIQADIQVLNGSIAEVTRNRDTLITNIQTTEANLAASIPLSQSFEETRASRLLEVDSTLVKLQEDKKTLEDTLSTYEKKRSALSSQIPPIEEQKARISVDAVELQRERAENESLHQATQREIAVSTSKIRTITDKITKLQTLGEGECPKCFQDIPSEFKETLGVEFEKEHQLALNEKRELETKLTDQRTSPEYLGIITRITETSTVLQGLDSKIREIRSEMDKVGSEESQVNHSLRTVDQNIATSTHQRTTIEQETNPYDLTAYETYLIRAREEKVTNEEILQGYQDKIFHCEFLADMFSSGGLKNYIFESIVGPLNARVEQYSRELTGGQLQIEFSTIKVLKNGKAKENFNITVTNSTGSKDYKGLSGGEKKRANILILRAARDILSERAHYPIGFCAYDEFTTDLDNVGKELVFQLIEKEAEERGTVFVITHDPEWKSRFEDKNRKVITATKKLTGVTSYELSWDEKN